MPDDIDEISSWSCPNGCGASGICLAGDEHLAIGVHVGGCPTQTEGT